MDDDKYLDLLQNIEWAIVTESRRDNSVLDLDARDAVGALVRHYEAEMESRELGARRLSPRAERIFAAVQAVCEWRVGRAGAVPGCLDPRTGPRTVGDVVVCLK